MTDDNSNLVDMDNLDSFSNTFFGTGQAPDPEPEAPEDDENEDINETGEDGPATEENEDTDTEGETEENEDEPKEEDKPAKKGKQSFQERINEVIAEAREAQRERDALAVRLAELEASRNEVKQVPAAPTPQPVAADTNGPKPTDLDDEGEPKYPLGEFDPAYIAAITRYTIQQERAAQKAEDAKIEQQRQIEAAQKELTDNWTTKVAETEAELPDLREKIADVGAAFQGIDPNYGEFLAASIMSCDNGPQIMYYLSQNIGEARKIVASGPAAATLAIGRLDAKFVKTVHEEKRNKPTAAPNPPEARTRGAGGKFSVAPDTTDLAAFEKEYFRK